MVTECADADYLNALRLTLKCNTFKVRRANYRIALPGMSGVVDGRLPLFEYV